MSFETIFKPLELSELSATAEQMKAEGYRFVQTLCVNTDDGIDIQYSFIKDGVLENYMIKGVKKGTKVPSITNMFLAAFVFENEAHDLFGVEIENIAIDFEGNFYAVSEKEPMTIITPEKKAAREKAAKIAAAKAAKEKGEKPEASKEAAVAKKMKDLDPEKAAKVKAALEAKKKKEAAQKSKETAEGKGE